MKKVIRLTESELTRLIKRVIVEQKSQAADKTTKPYDIFNDPNIKAFRIKDTRNKQVYVIENIKPINRTGHDGYMISFNYNGKKKIGTYNCSGESPKTIWSSLDNEKYYHNLSFVSPKTESTVYYQLCQQGVAMNDQPSDDINSSEGMA